MTDKNTDKTTDTDKDTDKHASEGTNPYASAIIPVSIKNIDTEGS